MPVRKSPRAFTLVEIAMVTAIIGLLAAIAVPASQQYTCRARQSETTAVMKTLTAGVAGYVAERSPAAAGPVVFRACDGTAATNAVGLEVTSKYRHYSYQYNLYGPSASPVWSIEAVGCPPSFDGEGYMITDVTQAVLPVPSHVNRCRM